MTENWRDALVETIRGLINRADPHISEEAKWRKPTRPEGVPTYSLDGLICTVETYKDKVKVTFARGASFEDPKRLFNASLDAGTRRAIDIHETDELDEEAFIGLIRSAIDFNRA